MSINAKNSGVSSRKSFIVRRQLKVEKEKYKF
jgi:hypothetical protein